MTYPAQLLELIEEFQDVESQMERLEMVFEMAEEVVALPVETWSDTTRILGCQSEAHVNVSLDEGKVLMAGGADAQLVQGLMGILTIAINGSAPAQALLLSPEFAQEMGILNSLSPSRSNGFRNMFDKVMLEIRKLEV
ncbi:MAG TPA: SufE family protein [Candidatus Poseidoniaceae archaeon]|nr:MAG TPA: SufE family protein [Candidatus Poseidoniales archaeon]HII10764.1 SufE family protein [Candidatus Poseidoniaceae archaeon]|tara:strand:+ start:78 stop:491 length:414 start_codon:yes stop_codon:yes gene_type:complete